MQLRYVFSELGQGLRRNLSMHVAVVLTLFVSLTLVGLGVLLHQQAERTAERYGNELQITVYLCREGDPEPSCVTSATQAQKQALQETIDESPDAESSQFVTRQQAFEQVQEFLGEDFTGGPQPAVTARDMPESIKITLVDPQESEGIVSAVSGLDGVSRVEDLREEVAPVFATLDVLQRGALGTAAFLVLAALLLVANTIRLAAFARRREIGIMRLVGASTLYITLPFLLEGLVTALVSLLLAGGALAALMHFGVQGSLEEQLAFIPWVQWPDFGLALLVMVVLGPLLTLVPTLLLTRKYIKV